MMPGVNWFQYSTMITPDVPRQWRRVAFSFTGKWYQVEWLESCLESCLEEGSHIITVIKLLPVVLGFAVLGSERQGKNIRCRCDNAAVVAILN